MKRINLLFITLIIFISSTFAGNLEYTIEKYNYFEANTKLLEAIKNGYLSINPPEELIMEVYVGSDIGQAVSLGRGYNSLLKQSLIQAVNIPVNSIKRIFSDRQFGSSGYARSLDEYYRNLGIDVKVSGSYMGFSGSDKTKFEKSNKNNKYLERYAAHVNIETFREFTELSNIELNPEAINVLKNQGVNEFYKRYGDSFIYSIQYGAGFKGVGSYQMVQSEKNVKFSHTSESAGGISGFGYKVNVTANKETKKKMEDEKIDIAIDSFGVAISIPQSITELKNVVNKFAKDASKVAKSSTYNDKYGGVLKFTIMKYSALPEFHKITGSNSLNLVEQRKIFNQLNYYNKKIQYMINNLDYVLKNIDEFPKQDTKTTSRQINELRKLQTSVLTDMEVIATYPFDRLKWDHNPNKYGSIPDYAPSTRLVRVKLEVPAELINQRDKVDDLWAERKGPLINNYSHTKGDRDGKGTKIDINIHTDLEVRSKGEEAWLKFEFLLKENRPDWTTFHGTKPYKVYEAPEGFSIVGFKKSREDYFLRNLNKNKPYASGPMILDVNNNNALWKDGHMKGEKITNPIWSSLNVIFDTKGNDYEVGAFGSLDFEIELKEDGPEIY